MRKDAGGFGMSTKALGEFVIEIIIGIIMKTIYQYCINILEKMHVRLHMRLDVNSALGELAFGEFGTQHLVCICICPRNVLTIINM